jgi:uncharacterized protein YjiS (DUF1127 family)
MTTVHYRSVPRVAVRPTLPAWLRPRLIALLRGWLKRARERRELTNLSDAQLRDVGLNRDAIKREVEKPFWMA